MSIDPNLFGSSAKHNSRELFGLSRLDRNQIFALTSLVKDRLGQYWQIWSVHGEPVGAMRRLDGSYRYFSSSNVQNGIHPSDHPVTLHNRLLLSPQECSWEYVASAVGKLQIWPKRQFSEVPNPNFDERTNRNILKQVKELNLEAIYDFVKYNPELRDIFKACLIKFQNSPNKSLPFAGPTTPSEKIDYDYTDIFLHEIQRQLRE